MGKIRGQALCCIALLLLMLLPAAMLSQGAGTESPSTYQTWKFNTSGDILSLSAVKDISGDGVDDVIIASNDKSIYLVDGLIGKKIWNYTASKFYAWLQPVTSSKLDVNNDTKSEILLAEKNGLVMLLDGATGAQIWNITNKDESYPATDPCFQGQRSIHITSDIDNDGLLDVIVVSSSGDQCAKNDKFSALALGTKNGHKLWEFVHDEDYHALKDGIRGSSPALAIDIDDDGVVDLVIIDDQSILYVIDGSTGNLVREKKLDVQGAIWNLLALPDLSGDAIEDALALEFIDGEGGPDHAGVDALDLVGSRVLWQVKAGDGLYKGGALYSAAWIGDNTAATPTARVAVTQRIDEQLQLVLIYANTGNQVWQFGLGEDKSKDDLNKYYPVARIPDLNNNKYDEIVVGSIDSRIYLLDGRDATILWSFSVGGGSTAITSLSTSDSQRYIVAANKLSEVRAMAGLTTIKTSLTLGPSSQNVTVSSKMVVSGAVSPPIPGEIVRLRYVDPTGSVTTRTLIIEKDGSFTDTIKPELIGTWKASAEFKGEGYYLDSNSPTISFTVENETRNSVYILEVKANEGDAAGVTRYPIAYFIEGGRVTGISVDEQQKSLIIALEPSPAGAPDQHVLKIELPRSVIDAWQSSYQVYIDGKIAAFQELDSGDYAQERALSIPFSSETREIQVIGTYIVPEFSGGALVILALTLVALVATRAIQGKLFSNSRGPIL